MRATEVHGDSSATGGKRASSSHSRAPAGFPPQACRFFAPHRRKALVKVSPAAPKRSQWGTAARWFRSDVAEADPLPPGRLLALSRSKPHPGSPAHRIGRTRREAPTRGPSPSPAYVIWSSSWKCRRWRLQLQPPWIRLSSCLHLTEAHQVPWGAHRTTRPLLPVSTPWHLA